MLKGSPKEQKGSPKASHSYLLSGPKFILTDNDKFSQNLSITIPIWYYRSSFIFYSNDVVVDGDDAFILGGTYCTGGSSDTVQHYDLTQPNQNAQALPQRLVSDGKKDITPI